MDNFLSETCEKVQRRVPVAGKTVNGFDGRGSTYYKVP